MEGIGFQVDTGEGIGGGVVRSLEVSDVRCELRDVVQVSDLARGEAVRILQQGISEEFVVSEEMKATTFHKVAKVLDG
jgi:hypothetical protein